MTVANPVLVEVTRGALVESRHRGAVAIADADGALVWSIGDVERPIYARSAIKPLQALPLVESGAAAHFALGDTELALACASHEGELLHTDAVAAWLTRIGLRVDALACGAHPPYHVASAEALVRSGTPCSALHNNCSGKHTGFLTTAVYLDEAVAGYVQPTHPVQRRVRDVLGQMCRRNLDRAPIGVDGCGIPVLGMDLHGIAIGMAQLADPSALSRERAAAARRIVDSMGRAPHFVAGTDRLCTALIEATGGRVVVKVGAEGVFTASLPMLGIGVALKIDDGGGRAAECAITALLERLGVLDDTPQPLATRWRHPTLRNRRGETTGRMEVTAQLNPPLVSGL